MFNASIVYRKKAIDATLVLVVRTTQANEVFVLPTKSTGTYDAVVDWGDGQTSEITAWNDVDLSHTYAAAGDYTVNISAGFAIIYFNYGAQRQKLISVDAINGQYKFTSMDNAFFGCQNFTTFSNIDCSDVLIASYAWSTCTGLTSFPFIDLSSAIDLRSAWSYCSGLTSFPAIDLPAAENVNLAWYGCAGLTSFPIIDLSNAVTVAGAWSYCSDLTSFPAINLPAAEDVSDAWSYCSGLTSFPFIDLSSANNLSNAWRGCGNLQHFPSGMFDYLPAPLNSCFKDAWRSCYLTDQSVENILVSIDASGRSAPESDKDITIGAATPYSQTSATTAAIASLKGKGWIIKVNGVTQ